MSRCFLLKSSATRARMGHYDTAMGIEPFEQHQPRVDPKAFVHQGAWVIGDVEIGAEASVWPAAVLRGDHGAIRLGAKSSFQDGAVAHATENVSTTVVGEECTVGHRVVLHGCKVS